MKRYSVGTVPGAYYVSDDNCKSFNMPQRAVTLNFSTFDAAKEVADLLNREWQAFLRNPK